MPYLQGKKPMTVGKKIKARVLYSFSATPPRFALSLAEHVVPLGWKQAGTSERQLLQEAYPLGKVLEVVTVQRLESEQGLYVKVEPGVEGFVHVRFSALVNFALPKLCNPDITCI
jgi:rRNA biogenesis protein RRP5